MIKETSATANPKTPAVPSFRTPSGFRPVCRVKHPARTALYGTLLHNGGSNRYVLFDGITMHSVEQGWAASLDTAYTA